MLNSVLLTACGSKGNKSKAVSPTTPTVNLPVDTTVKPKPTDTLPPEQGKLNVVAAFPGPEEPRVALTSAVVVTFDDALIAGLTLDNLIVVKANGAKIDGKVSLKDVDTLMFRATRLLNPDTIYTIQLSDALMSADGLSIGVNEWQFTTVGDVFTTPQYIIDMCMSELDIEMLAAVNAARVQARKCGDEDKPAVGKLTWNCQLQASALTHSTDMATHDFFDHTGSDGSTVGKRVTIAGYMYEYAGENLAAGQRNVTEAMAGLLKSPSHCENLMSVHYKEFGSALVINPDTVYKRYWTQNFGAQRF